MAEYEDLEQTNDQNQDTITKITGMYDSEPSPVTVAMRSARTTRIRLYPSVK